MSKIGSPRIANIPTRDSCFTEAFASIRNLGIFYGTHKEGNRDDYLSAVKKALNSRIAEPVAKWYSDPKTCFFKPYHGPMEKFQATYFGLINPVFALVSGLGLIGVNAANPVNLISFFCLPAIMELLAVLVGVGQTMWYQAKALIHRRDEDPSMRDEEQAKADDYFLDAMVRFALVIPLAIVSLISAPFELVRFVTRSIATLVGYFPSSESNLGNMQEDELDVSATFSY